MWRPGPSVCVLAGVLGAVDRGYRVVVPTDALCSSSDRTHDALLTLYRERYGQQVETVPSEETCGRGNDGAAGRRSVSVKGGRFERMPRRSIVPFLGMRNNRRGTCNGRNSFLMGVA